MTGQGAEHAEANSDSGGVIERAIQFLRGHSKGELRFAEHVRPVRYITAHDGRIVMPAMVAMLEAMDTVLFVPAWGDEAMELQLTLEAIDERGEAGAVIDKWRIYHGEPEDVKWASCLIDSARSEGVVIDGDGLMVPNTLARAEGKLCKWMNTERREQLRNVCERFGTMAVEEPVMVGIDPWGFDVRARFDVARVPFVRRVRDEAAARQEVERMINEAHR